MFDISRRIRSRAKEYQLEPLADLVIRFIESGDESLLSSLHCLVKGLETLCNQVIFDKINWSWSEKEDRLVALSFHLIRTKPAGLTWREYPHGEGILSAAAELKYHREVLGYDSSCQEFIDSLESTGYPTDAIYRILMPDPYGHGWKNWFVTDSQAEPEWKTAFERHVWAMDDDTIGAFRPGKGMPWNLAVVLSRFRHPALRRWLQQWRANAQEGNSRGIKVLEDLLEVTDAFDEEIVGIMEIEAAPNYLWALERKRPGKYHSQMHGIAVKCAARAVGLPWLAKNDPVLAVRMVSEVIDSGAAKKDLNLLLAQPTLQVCAERFAEGGKEIFEKLLSPDYARIISSIVETLALHAPEVAATYVQGYCDRAIAMVGPAKSVEVWRALLSSPRFLECYVGELKKGLEDKTIRHHAQDALRQTLKDEGYYAYLRELLLSDNKDSRTLGLLLLGEDYAKKGKCVLLEALSTAPPKAFRERILKALVKQGVDISPYHDEKGEIAKPPADDLVPAKQRRPVIAWLDLKSLPLLRRRDGTTMREAGGWMLLEKQRNHRWISKAPALQGILDDLDPTGNGDFAMQVLESFLASERKANGSWALAVAGITGDSRVIARLLPLIKEWCENSRHKLAEYAAQAISLLPGNEPLMVLDTLSNRYRSKFKNVGKACAEAFNAAAAARGITTDELGDLVVPDFGFDSEGIRRFDWNGGGASAEFGADFKLTWFDPETDKAWKALPASAPEEIKTKVKTLSKLLREAVKGQTSRLEMTLVRQRRWPVARWRELFENHPLLRSFASSLVWGVYDSTGKLLRTFRRYPNGLLADATGALEELPESDTMIGMVHPLELEAAALDAWRAHLTRFKVKAPFPQIDRPVELLDPLHGNRRSITLTDKKSVSAGTFRSRAEKRGWNRGSVVDAGGISSYYKLYPGAGVEVILPTENFWIGCDPMETIVLCPAYFVKAESVERGSYVYNEPEPDDPRVMRFHAVPAVVWSETVSDLKAIVATKE